MLKTQHVFHLALYHTHTYYNTVLGIYIFCYVSDIMVLEIDVNADSVKKLEKFLGTGKYKDLVTNTKSFSRKLNEERKMRLPYVCGQVITLMFCAESNYFYFPDWSCPKALQHQQESL